MRKKEFLLSNDLSRVQKITGEVADFLKPLKLDDAVLFDIRLCLEEALINAMKHGNKLDPSKRVRMVVEDGNGEIRFAVEDEGEGFDPGGVRDCTEGENLLRNGGRGVYLMRQLMDRVEYNSKGNRVLMAKSLAKTRKK